MTATDRKEQLEVSIVIPAYNEDEAIERSIRRISEAVHTAFEVVVVVDSPEDSTIRAVEAYAAGPVMVRVLIQDGRGPAAAIRFGIKHALAPVVVVTMADGSDDPACIDALVRLVERGCVIAAASRYMPGGQQIGGPKLKSWMSRGAGKSLKWFAGVTTADATNSFKAYSKAFIEEVGIDSANGFEVGIELIAKARRLRRPVAEVPTIWLDRDSGSSRFQLKAWLPHYLMWYRMAYGPQLTPEQLRRTVERRVGP
jgi:dolichol-phosphate mannosyltransferase